MSVSFVDNERTSAKRELGLQEHSITGYENFCSYLLSRIEKLENEATTVLTEEKIQSMSINWTPGVK